MRNDLSTDVAFHQRLNQRWSCNTGVGWGQHPGSSEHTGEKPTVSFPKMKNSVFPDTDTYTYWSGEDRLL